MVRPRVIIAILMLAGLACSAIADLNPFGGNGLALPGADRAAEPQSSSPTPDVPPADFYDVNGNPAYPDPPVREVVDLMLAQVEAGELELVDGVVELMRALASEQAPPEFIEQPDGKMQFESVWGLTALAYDLYQISEDSELKAELDSLLRVLAPSAAVLEPYSAPADSVALPGAPGLSLIERQELSCNEIWHEGFPESAGPVPTCLLYNSFTAGGHPFNVYFPLERNGDTQFMSYVGAATEALADSQARYSELVEVRSTNVVFSLISADAIGGPQAGVAMVPSFDPAELGSLACPITVFSGAFDMDLDSFKQLIAHEVFHCVHLWRKGVSGYSVASWYNEGMANYFSNLVYPTVNHEHDFVDTFHQESPTKSILDMSYANTVFFQYLGNRFGDPWLIDFLDGMPLASKGAMMSYMAGIDGMDVVLREFAQAYLDGEIADTGGGVLPGSALIPNDRLALFPEQSGLELQAKPFHVERAMLAFEAEHTYDLGLDLSGAAAQEAAKRTPTGSWQPLPERVAACDEIAQYVVVMTTIGPGSTEAEASALRLDLQDFEESACDECLVGEWVHDVGTSGYWVAVVEATADNSTHLVSVEGTHRLIFREDGTFESSTQDQVVVWRGAEVNGNVTEVLTTSNRSASGTYSTNDTYDQLQMLETESQGSQETVTVVSGPLGTFGSDPTVTTQTGGELQALPEGASYSCTDTTLIHQDEGEIVGTSGEVWTGTIEFSRVGSPH